MRNAKVAKIKTLADISLRALLVTQLLVPGLWLPALAEDSAQISDTAPAVPIPWIVPKKPKAKTSRKALETLNVEAKTEAKSDETNKVEAKTEETNKAEVKTDETNKAEVKIDETKKVETSLEETKKVDETAKAGDSDDPLVIDNDDSKPKRQLSTTQTSFEADPLSAPDKAVETNATATSSDQTTIDLTTTASDSQEKTADNEKGVSIAATAIEPKLDVPDKGNLTGLPKGSILSPETADLSGHILDVEQADLVADAPIVVDNDEAIEAKATIAYQELPTDDGKTRIVTGARFPVVISSQINSKTAKKGDPLEARLKYDLKIGEKLVAKKGSKVSGHIDYCLPARSVLHSLVSPTRWYRNSGCLGITFDEIITDSGEHLPLAAAPARQGRIIKNKGEGRELGVNHHGQITGPWGQQLRYKAVRVGLNFAMAPVGVFSFGAMPVALGVMGAINPSFAFMKPVGLNVRHRRLKGFAWGFLSGIPGSWLIEDTVTKGQEAIVKPGDEFLAEFKQEFTGEPASEATLLPGSKAKVKGEVMTELKKKGKKKGD